MNTPTTRNRAIDVLDGVATSGGYVLSRGEVDELFERLELAGLHIYEDVPAPEDTGRITFKDGFDPARDVTVGQLGLTPTHPPLRAVASGDSASDGEDPATGASHDEVHAALARAGAWRSEITEARDE